MSPARAIAGGLAVAGCAVALGGPLQALAGRPSFVVHVLQVVLLSLVVAPLGLLALPAARVEAWLGRPGRARAMRRLASPPLAGAIFSAHLAFWHLVPVHAWMTASSAAHATALAGFFVSGLLAWWGVCAPTAETGRVREPAAMLYLFLLGVPLQLIAGILTMTPRLLYAGYGAGPRGFGLSPLADQQAGGLILWVPAGLVLWIAITALWARWSRRVASAAGKVGGDDEAPPLTIPGKPRR